MAHVGGAVPDAPAWRSVRRPVTVLSDGGGPGMTRARRGLALVAAALACVPPRPAPTSTTPNLPATAPAPPATSTGHSALPRVYRGDSGLTAPRRLVVRDAAAWRALWVELLQPLPNPAETPSAPPPGRPPAPPVDFGRDMLLVAAGECWT